MNQPLRYQFYATLLDKYQSYLDFRIIYNQYWGFSEEPPFTEEEFEEKQRQDLINQINRVPFKSAAADRGTAFNDIVDCLIERTFKEVQKNVYIYNGEKTVVIILPESQKVVACINDFMFEYDLSVCKEFAEYYKGAITQLFTAGILSTRYGDVRLYGYIDELMPLCVHDIKFTKSYTVGKFRRNWQHIVYPFTLNQEGNNITDFEYNIAQYNDKKSGTEYETFSEHYSYVPDRDIPRLVEVCEGLIEFIEAHRDVITDKKIFNITE
ncbi:hypothetical protein GGR21_002506 [Dysgonomonas hofstadii]|uniref:Uncharacterized protein n=1 Tax=Dysgonomonas hofstadii TaxID=637886 RepID=A0A840CKU1_9BACT|nr:HNH endonuclease [Dysgonomonas hofstadii]MBB4036600.1 hypothetical protein [Dysgonomonas hofstadii]